jgi:hypothetical protein
MTALKIPLYVAELLEMELLWTHKEFQLVLKSKMYQSATRNLTLMANHKLQTIQTNCLVLTIPQNLHSNTLKLDSSASRIKSPLYHTPTSHKNLTMMMSISEANALITMNVQMAWKKTNKLATAVELLLVVNLSTKMEQLLPIQPLAMLFCVEKQQLYRSRQV